MADEETSCKRAICSEFDVEVTESRDEFTPVPSIVIPYTSGMSSAGPQTACTRIHCFHDCDVLDPMSEGRVIGFWRKLTEREVCYKCPLLFHVLGESFGFLQHLYTAILGQ